MKSIKQIFYSLILSMMIALISPAILPVPGQIAQVEAATKLNKKSVILIKGQSVTLKITGVAKNVKWQPIKNLLRLFLKKEK